MDEKITLETLAGGAVEERFNDALQEVLANIIDPNTDYKAKRKIQMTVTFNPREKRDFSVIDCGVKVTLAPQKSVETAIYIGRNGKGQAVAAEMAKQAAGQIYIDDKSGEVIDLQKKTATK